MFSLVVVWLPAEVNTCVIKRDRAFNLIFLFSLFPSGRWTNKFNRTRPLCAAGHFFGRYAKRAGAHVSHILPFPLYSFICVFLTLNQWYLCSSQKNGAVLSGNSGLPVSSSSDFTLNTGFLVRVFFLHSIEKKLFPFPICVFFIKNRLKKEELTCWVFLIPLVKMSVLFTVWIYPEGHPSRMGCIRSLRLSF